MSLGVVVLFPVIFANHRAADESEHSHRQCPHLHAETQQEVFVSSVSQDFRKVTLVETVQLRWFAGLIEKVLQCLMDHSSDL